MANLTGKRFGRLEALAPIHRRDVKGRSTIDWRCICDCSNECIVAGGALRSGLTRSCGCLLAESRVSKSTKHGGVRTRLYHIWLNMRARCGDPTYLHYCGRGIRVCAQWQASFEQFRADVGEPPTSRHSLDRYPNNNGDYEPGNVRWATASQQARNKRNSVHIEIDGTKIGLADAAEQFGIAYDTLHNRIKAGWSPRQAVNLDARPRPGGWKVLNRKRRFNGEPVFATRDR